MNPDLMHTIRSQGRQSLVSMAAMTLGVFSGFLLGTSMTGLLWHYSDRPDTRPLSERVRAVHQEATPIGDDWDAWRDGYREGLESSGLYQPSWQGTVPKGVVR